MSPDYLVAGAFIGSILTFVAIAIPRYTRHLLAATLVGAAFVYVHIALGAHAGAAWLAIELTGVALYGALALRGFRRSAWWLAAGWALHPVWDVALHVAGPGRAFAPEWYTVTCVTWDIATAAIIAVAILIGTHLSEPLSSRAVRAQSARAVEESLAVSATRFTGTTTARFLDSLRSLGMTVGRLSSLGMTGARSFGMTAPPAQLAPACACRCPSCTAREARAA